MRAVENGCVYLVKGEIDMSIEWPFPESNIVISYKDNKCVEGLAYEHRMTIIALDACYWARKL